MKEVLHISAEPEVAGSFDAVRAQQMIESAVLSSSTSAIIDTVFTELFEGNASVPPQIKRSHLTYQDANELLGDEQTSHSFNSAFHIDAGMGTTLGYTRLPTRLLKGTVKIPNELIEVYFYKERATTTPGYRLFMSSDGRELISAALAAGDLEEIDSYDCGTIFTLARGTLHATRLDKPYAPTGKPRLLVADFNNPANLET